MKKKFSAILLAVFISAGVFQGCKSKEPCPAYANQQTEVTTSESLEV